MASQKDIKQNKQFGRLTALSQCARENSKDRWLFKCSCGNTLEAYAYNVACGKTKSCGCYAKEVYRDKSKKFKLPEGEASRNQLFLAYKRGAVKRKLKFELNLKLFEQLTSANCHYCGVAPANVTKRGKSMPANGEYTYNGIDRLDSTLGYIIGNIVSCCTTCNYAKNSLTYAEFMVWIKRLINFNTGEI